MKNKIMILTAHLDDFEIGMGGTVAKLCKNNHVYLIVLCKGDRPGHESVGSPRKAACICNCDELGITNINLYEYSDTRLDQVSQTELCDLVYTNIRTIKPTTVYTHYSNDIHKDHRILSDACKVACRMRTSSPVNELYEFTIPGSTEWSHTPTHFNLFENITDHISDKMEMISRYTSEVRPSPDPVSLEMIMARDRYYGSLCGYPYAEVFNTVFKRCT